MVGSVAAAERSLSAPASSTAGARRARGARRVPSRGLAAARTQCRFGCGTAAACGDARTRLPPSRARQTFEPRQRTTRRGHSGQSGTVVPVPGPPPQAIGARSDSEDPSPNSISKRLIFPDQSIQLTAVPVDRRGRPSETQQRARGHSGQRRILGGARRAASGTGCARRRRRRQLKQGVVL